MKFLQRPACCFTQCLFILFAACLFHPAIAQLSVDAEANVIAGVPYNKVRIPARGGTQFDLANDLKIQNRLTYRVRVNYLLGKRHVVSALYAPLTIRSRGMMNRDIVYSGETYSAGENINAVYKFNSYRLTYRYMFKSSEKFKFGLGLTGKIRDADITLSQEGTTSDFPDLGVVPLFNFYFDLRVFENTNVLLEGDALGSKQGRAEDVFLGVTYAFSESLSAKAGMRILEGGADVDRNYNFTWVNYVSAGVIFNCRKEKE
jgi:hypothetical protein